MPNESDITEQKDTLSLFCEPEEAYKLFFHNLPVAAAIVREGIVIDVNDACLKMFRCRKEDKIGKHADSFASPKDLPRLIELRKSWSVHGVPDSPVEFTGLRPDGTTLELEASIVNHPTSEYDLCISVFTDITERKAREAELLASEAFFRTLAETASVGLVLHNLEGEILYTNRFMEQLIGVPAKELKGDFKSRLASTANYEILKAAIHLVSTGETVSGIEVDIFTKDGNTCLISVTMAPIYQNGQVKAAVSVVQEIEPLKQAEAALVKSEQKFQALADALPVGIIDADKYGRILFLNKETTVITGFPSEELLGTTRLFAHEDDTPAVMDIIERVIKGEGTRNHDCRFVRKDGSYVWLSLSLEPKMLDGEFSGVYAVLADISQRKAAENALKESEARFRSFIENTSDLITVMDAQGKVRYISPAAQKISGFTIEELAGLNVFDFIHPDDLIKAAESLSQLLTNPGSTVKVEVRQRRKDGEWVDLEVAGSSVLDEDGIPYIVLNSRDITARKASEKALRESEKRYRGLIESQSDLIVRVDTEGRFTFVNEAYCRTFGKCPSELLGQSFVPLVHPDDIERTLSEMKKLEVPPYRFTIEQRALTVNGWRWIFWEDCAVMDEAGNIVEVQAIGRDITEQKAAEQALRESESKFRSYMNQSIDAIVVLDGEGKFLEANPAVFWASGYSEEEILNRTIWDLAAPGELTEEFLNGQFNQLFETGKSFCELTIQRKDGSTFVVEAYTVALDARRFMSVVRDITERKKAEEAVLKSLDALEKAYAMQSEFVRNMTHEVRTPLTGVIGYAQALLDGVTGSVSDEQRKVLKRIVTQAESLLAIVEEVLESARLAAGIRKLDLRTIKLDQVIGNAVRLSEASAGEKGIALECRVPTKLPVLVSDAQKLTRILSNIISNAVKFTFKGSVTIEVEKTTDGVDVIVADSGMGIPVNRQDNIFDEFVQLSFPGKHKPVGAGLGLSIVRELVDVLGCSLTLSSLPGVGTAFTLHVPANVKEAD